VNIFSKNDKKPLFIRLKSNPQLSYLCDKKVCYAVFMSLENILIQSGLSQEQALVYENLLEKGPQRATSISKWAGIKRGLVYKILEQLDNLGIVEKKGGAGTVAVFYPNHPSLLLKMIETKEKELLEYKNQFEVSLGQLISKYNLLNNRPNVLLYEGISGIEKIYKDVINEGKDILLIQSPYDDEHPEIAKLVEEQIKKQVSKNIKVRALTPLEKTTREFVQNYDKNNLVERRIIPREKLDVPSQIMIYGENVGISTLKGDIITTIIEDPLITTMFRSLFEYMWEKSETEHKEIISSFDL